MRARWPRTAAVKLHPNLRHMCQLVEAGLSVMLFRVIGNIVKIALIVNPDAGLGGILAFKGTDGLAEKARKAGAIERSGPRTERMIESLNQLLKLNSNIDFEILTPSGKMGEYWCKGAHFQITVMSHQYSTPHTTAEDTKKMVIEAIKQEASLFVISGGDGTMRDVVEVFNKKSCQIPIIGIPSGVKMYSGTFASSPEAAAEVLLSYVQGLLHNSTTEIMDLDEELYRSNIWSVRLFSEAITPSSPRFIQGSKEIIESSLESEIIEAMAKDFEDRMLNFPERIWLWGSGGTLETIGKHIGFSSSLLGIDAVKCGNIIQKDLDYKQLFSIAKTSSDICLVLSPMGGQGFLIGRGNLQLSPESLKLIGTKNILAVATPGKVATLPGLRIETGDLSVDRMFSQVQYIPTVIDFGVQRMIRVITDI